MTPATEMCHCVPEEHVTCHSLPCSFITGKTYSAKLFFLKKLLSIKVDGAK